MKKNKKKKNKSTIHSKNKKTRKTKQNALKKIILEKGKYVPHYNLFLDNINKNSIKTDSFYNMTFYENTSFIDNNNYLFKKEIENQDNIIKCDKVVLLPSKEQSISLLNMLEGYRLVYNLTLQFINKRNFYNAKDNIKVDIKANTKDDTKDYIKANTKELKKLKRIAKINDFKTNNKPIFDSQIIRTYFLKEKIKEIAIKFKTPVHSLDYAVQLACASFKSCFINLKNKNITHFKIRYIKKNKSSLMMDIEKTAVDKEKITFIKSILGKEIKNKNNSKYDFTSDFKLHYNKQQRVFTLLIPKKVEKNPLQDNTNYISIDPGLRVFLNCKTNNKYVEIGSNVSSYLKKELIKLDKLNNINKKIKNKIKKRNLVRIRYNIKNKITDMHWKIINYLTNNYNTIIIGKWSTKSIINNQNSVLSKMNKRISQSISFYQFLLKLEYKCNTRNICLKKIDESYTSKTCSLCGYIKNDLGGNKIYECKKCNSRLDRDYNSCRNILLKSLI